MRAPVLTHRAWNRAILARQMLLERVDASAIEAVRRLMALQSQDPRPPFLSLWARLRTFRREDLAHLIARREAVRAPLLRGTLHVVAADDYGWLRQTLRKALAAHSLELMRARKAAFDPDPVEASARRLLAKAPMLFSTLRERLAEAFPQDPPDALSYIPRLRLPLTVEPGAAPWCYAREATFRLADDLAESTGADVRLLVRRALAANGPATVANLQAWTRLTRLAPVVAAMEDLTAFQDETGRIVYDLAGADRPPEDTPAPVRLVPEFDAVTLGHVEPAAILPRRLAKAFGSRNGRFPPRILIDGFAAGTWTSSRVRQEATLALQLMTDVSAADRRALKAEAEGLIRFIEPEASKWRVRLLEA